MGVTIRYSNSHLDYFTRNLIACQGDQVATACGYTSVALLEVLAGAAEPITLEEAKQHLRTTGITAEDDLVEQWIRAARTKVEADTGLVLRPSRWRVIIDQFPSWRQPLRLPIFPIVSIDDFGYYDRDGVLQTTGSPAFLPLTEARPQRLYLATDEQWPTTHRQYQPGFLDVTAGYTTPELVPEDLKQGIKLLVGQSDLYRQPITAGPGQTVNSVGFDYDRWISAWVLPSV